jgi:hypothetical protein
LGRFPTPKSQEITTQTQVQKVQKKTKTEVFDLSSGLGFHVILVYQPITNLMLFFREYEKPQFINNNNSNPHHPKPSFFSNFKKHQWLEDLQKQNAQIKPFFPSY